MIYIGIDPGVSGGIAILREDGSPIRVVKMPETEADIFSTLRDWVLFTDTTPKAVLERVWSSPGWGHVGAFKFGLNYGSVRMALTVAGISFEEVLPQRWQKALGCLSGKDKNITKRRAQQLFPQVKVTHHVADSLLLAEFCRRQERQYGQEGSRQEEGGKASRETETPAIAQGSGKGHARRQSAQG